MFASHALDKYVVGGRQNVWKASFAYSSGCGMTKGNLRMNKQR